MSTLEDARKLIQAGIPASKSEAEHLLERLRNAVRYHEKKYYVEDNPEISDFEYDQLFDKLKEVEAEFPSLITEDSPTQRVGADLTQNFVSVAHLTPMLSLDNSYNAEDLREFDRQVRKLTGQAHIEYCVEPKFDGGTIAVVYEEDRLNRAATRGDGVHGEEITANAKTIKTIPLKAPFSKVGIQKAELRGEAILRKDRFRKLNKEREEEELPLFANPRNAATGSLRMKDPKETAARGLEVFFFQLGYAVDERGRDQLGQFATHDAALEFLEKLHFKVPVAERKVCRDIDEVIRFCEAWEAKRDSYPYEIDGMVIKVNQRELQDLCGYTSHHPRWAMAFKFQARQATTRLVAVEFQVGKVGSITPVAKLEPVQLAGVTISSVSLHNEDFIQSKDIRIGDEVLVERAGDVIPYIVKPVLTRRTGAEVPIKFPRYCPLNSEEKVALIREPGEAAWRCPHCTCGAQDMKRIMHFVSKDAMDIEGLGKSLVEKFFTLGWLKTFPDIYRLDYNKISELEGFGQKSASNLRKAIEESRSKPIHRLLYGLCIHHLGKRVSGLLAERLDHVLDLADWKEADFLSIRDVGPVVARNILDFFSRKENIHMLRQLEELGVNLRHSREDEPVKASADSPLFGKTILFTGTLSTVTREEAEEAARKAGAKVLSGVSKNLNILVVGAEAGSKLQKAKDLGTVLIADETTFLNWIKEANQ